MGILDKLAWHPTRRTFTRVILTVFCLLFLPLLTIFHQAIVLLIAIWLQGTASSLLVKGLLVRIGFDPVYASVLNRTMGDAEAKGLAVAGPVGDALHQLMPGVFAPCDQVMPGAWTSALISDGASVLAVAIARTGAAAALIAIGLAILSVVLWDRRIPRSPLSLALTVLGILLQVRGLTQLLKLHFSAVDFEIMGLSQFFTKVFPVDAGTYQQLVSGPLQSLAPYVVPSLVIVTIYGILLAIILVRTRRHLGKNITRARRWSPLQIRLPRFAGRTWVNVASIAMFLLASSVVSAELLPAQANYDYALGDQDIAAQIAGDLTPLTTPTQGSATTNENQQAGPSKVIISGGNYSYSLTVNGQPERLKGVGYNALYSNLSAEDRAARYDWDFAEMKAAGVNTILGWGIQKFDDLTLEKAQEYGLGVVMPYGLSTVGDYADPAYQQQVESSVREWVERYKGYPALRMWGIGNEVIHHMNPNTPRAKAFARFYVGLADEVHALDPDHPVIYRDAEDINFGPVKEVLLGDGVHRPWFVYGGNFFTNRICEALPNWPNEGIDIPMLVSEFEPSGASPSDRPKGYIHMLRCIFKQPAYVLGAFAYVWTTDGPETLDQVMGLVDDRGQPVDGSLRALATAFRNESGGR